MDWSRLEKLHAPRSLSVALENLGIRRISIVRKELRQESEREWISVPQWLKDTHPFVEMMERNEVAIELIRRNQEEAREESFRLQESVCRKNGLGYSELLVPLVLRGDRIGFIMIGGFITEEARPGDVELEDRFRKLMLQGEELQQAISAYRTLPFFTSDKYAIVLQMGELLANEVIQFFDEAMQAKEREEAVHKATFSQMVTTHPPLRQLLKKIPQIGESDSTVLIYGEPGTGRELLSHMIHERSPRKDGPFKTLHCASVAENLLEAELLGYEQGAFAGAYETKKGLFELCEGGSLYLKEIGDLSLSMQLKILRLIQDNTFTRLGGSEILKTDVRIIASTQRNIKKLVQMGTFREDLYFRLNVVELELPPLRTRRQDISLIAEHFLQVFVKQMKKEGIQWTEQALTKIASHPFPGNVRELKNEVERLVALKQSHSFIEAKDLSAKISESMSPIEEIEKGRPLKQIVDEFERKIVSEALQKYHWNKSRVADLFQITRQGLMKKITKHQLDKRRF